MPISNKSQVASYEVQNIDWNKSVRYVKGVGEKFAEKLNKYLGINTLYDLIFYPPYAHHDRTLKLISDLKEDEQACIKGTVESYKYIPRGVVRIEAVIKDNTGVITAVWFGRRYVLYTLRKGIEVMLSGKTNIYNGRFQIQVEDYTLTTNNTATLLHFGGLIPQYSVPERAGKYTKRLRTAIHNALQNIGDSLQETLPPWILSSHNLTDLKSALYDVHFPKTYEKVITAHKRLCYEEAFFMFLALKLSQMKLKKKSIQNQLKLTAEIKNRIEQNLPFNLTNSQKKVISQIITDLQSKYPMYRLLQGDVGSGKTIVCFYALMTVALNGCQGALLVPTEILAEQHFRNFSKMFPGCKAALLTASTPKKERTKIIEGIKENKFSIVIGTHALLQQDVEFSNLMLVVIDEQHKFGVLQRDVIIKKGYNPHVLTMTATPIPRSLALTLFGDADISVLDELPPNRKDPITSHFVKSKWLDSLKQIKQELNKGHQAYFVYPLIEESDRIQASSATEMYEELLKLLPEYKIALIHGRIGKQAREQIMNDFRSDKINILVSTVVIEIGVDVPNATVMVIDNAERFGLSQLHQLRGRIVRSDKTPYCILIAKRSTEDAQKRIKIMLETSNGFLIAEEDLKIRGPGEFIGMEQKGFTRFRFLNLIENFDVLLKAKEDAGNFIKRDPNLVSNWGTVFRERLELIYKDKMHLGAIV